MADAPSHRAPGWPLSRAELDDVEMLEMTRDEEGHVTWKSQAPPASPEALRGWMPKRHRESSQAHLDWPPGGNSAAAIPPPSELPDEPLLTSAPVDDILPTRLDMSGAPAVNLVDLLPDLCPTAAPSPAAPPVDEWSAVMRPPTAASDVGGDVTASACLDDSPPIPSLPPMRIGLATSMPALASPVDAVTAEPHSTRPASTPPRVLDTLERLALVAAGILIGMVLTLVWGLPANSPPASTSVATVAPANRRPDNEEHQAGNHVSRPAVAEPASAAGVGPGPAGITSSASIQASAAVDASPVREPARRVERPPGITAPEPSGPTAAVAAMPRDTSDEMRHRAVMLTERRVRPADERAASSRHDRAKVVTAVSGDRSVGRREVAAPAARVRSAPPAALDVVQRYAVAYSRMDARATQAVWPAADRQMLASTFNALREQRLTLSGCRGQLVDVGATVACRGTLRYRPRLGDHSTRTRQGTWRFALAPDGDTWRIDLVTEP